MITKDQLLQSLTHEANITTHLYAKLNLELFDYRPAKNMRSIKELLQHLTMCGIGPAKSLVNNNWEIAKAYREDAAKMEVSQFPTRMAKQVEELKALFGELTDSDLRTREVTFPWGGGDKLGMALVNTTLKFFTAYRMQLFLYAKMAGLSELNTMNCWRGTDMPAKQP